MQFPIGVLSPKYSAMQQLKQYPLPRFYPGNKLHRLFNWADPYYLAGRGQPKFTNEVMNKLAYNLQEELILNWNYGINLPNSAFDSPDFISLANKYPDIPLHVITFWMAVKPQTIGYNNIPKSCIIGGVPLDSNYYITFNFYGKTKTEIKLNFPDSLIAIDGKTQKFYLQHILKSLTRPIDLINENGEEPPGPYLLSAMKNDKDMIELKNSLGISSWTDFMAERKHHMRNVYSSQFMKELPQLKNTAFSIYTIEGGPVDRFDWHISKTNLSPINGIYYSTPDFYPRWPKNWKYWSGPWHGWSWIESGRKIEIKDGDYLFSPFVAAGWSENPIDDVRPSQWLGLLKCLSVVGAEFYYVGYFNEKQPFTKPEHYVWQVAMPAYAQAITSRFEDVLKNGNVLFNDFGEPIISYPSEDKHILLTMRKENNKEKYVIAATYQPFSNVKDEIAEKRSISIKIKEETLTIEARQQGSVYMYEKTNQGKTIFYQLDKWHEKTHPNHWTSNFEFEAELTDTAISNDNIYTTTPYNAGNYTNFTTYIQLTEKQVYPYYFTVRDSLSLKNNVWFRYKGNGIINISLTNTKRSKDIVLPSAKDWKWFKYELSPEEKLVGVQVIKLKLTKGDLALDRFIINNKSTNTEK